MKLIKIVKATKFPKKYCAILKNKNRTKKVCFGDRRYQHYHDKIGKYRHLDHKDKKRRAAYRRRHKGENKKKYSAGYFAWKYLW
jgi:hypothetical protein